MVATTSFEQQRPASTKSSQKSSKRNVFSSLLKHLAPHVDTEGAYDSQTLQNRSLVFIARSH